MYDNAVSATYSKLGTTSVSNGWSVGDACLARYSCDNLFYPAKIVEIRDEDSMQPEYRVEYDGYDDTDWVYCDDLMPVTSEDDIQMNGSGRVDNSLNEGPIRLDKTSRTSRGRTYRRNNDFPHRFSGRPHPTIPSIAPPPPSVHAGISVRDEGEALSSMLMSWYMSGYHTGYYQAIKDMNSKK
ncbi:hypothetical protein KIN20_035475 [Parelaphostrongylus tenuis]|uniref:Tudor domain-containing protein n=1 Tax=Parelaphostrongylus tenuis TaxID=148309 RepID=A0AAD5REH6_PARTN|nr:hypothetical protein KIN20_035475 [Parelaphostrongylus tenuis]